MAKRARKFGVELECVGGSGANTLAVACALSAAGIACERQSYNHDTASTWKIVPDGSVNGVNPFELVSPPMPFSPESVETLRKVCEVLNRLGVSVNSSCGFHVHVDASDLNATHLKNLVAMFCRFESVMDSLVPPSRRSNYYAQSNAVRLGRTDEVIVSSLERANDARDLRDLHGRDRYRKLNLEALGRHGTVEFRQAAGTTNADKVVGWVAMCVGLVSSAKHIKMLRSKTQFTFSRLLGRVAREYRPLLVARRREFAANERRVATRRANERARRERADAIRTRANELLRTGLGWTAAIEQAARELGQAVAGR